MTNSLSQLKAIIQDAQREYPVTHGVFLGACGGEIASLCSFGGVEAELHKPFPIASLTKQFTAVAILQLLSENGLSVQTPLIEVCENLHRLNGYSAKVTFKQLLTHTAHSSMGAEASFTYSNDGYMLLGTMIEYLSGRTLGEYFAKNLFQKAGMTNSRLPEGRDKLASYGAAGGVIATAEDLWAWNQALYNGRLLEAEALSQMTSLQVAKASYWEYDAFAEGYYGYGLDIYCCDDKVCYQHCGGIEKYQAKMTYIPQIGVSLIYLLENYEESMVAPIFAFSNHLTRRLLSL